MLLVILALINLCQSWWELLIPRGPDDNCNFYKVVVELILGDITMNSRSLHYNIFCRTLSSGLRGF